MNSSIISSLGAGSGLDTAGIVRDLSAASRVPKVQRFDSLARANNAKISAVAQLRASLEGFSSSLAAVVGEGSTLSRPVISDETILGATLTVGGQPSSVPTEVIVTQLARAQTAYSGVVASASAPIGQGTMTLTAGGIAHAINIGPANDSLNGLVDAINGSGAGVVASLVADGGGSRLILKGQTGLANSFTLTSDAGADPGLDNFATGSGLTIGQNSQDAQLSVDGISFTRASNTVSDVLSGMTLTLKRASSNTPVSIYSQRSTVTLKQTVTDFVTAFNNVVNDIKAAQSANPGDPGLRRLEANLRSMVNNDVTSDADLNSFSDLGISTARDGTLVLNTARLDTILGARPEAVEALFNPLRDGAHTATTDPGLSTSLTAITNAATASNGELGALKSRLEARAKAIGNDREKMEAREAAYTVRLERQFGGLDARLNVFQATRNYLEQQVKLWTRSN